MYIEILQELGLAKNEAQIYVTLAEQGELSVSGIATHSGINRRNIYDTLEKLVEKGLVFEIVDTNERRFQAVEPGKLLELVEERRTSLLRVLPALEQKYKSVPFSEKVFLYRGIEGWKNALRDMLRVGEDVYTIGGKGAWTDERFVPFFVQFNKEAKRKKMRLHILFEAGVKGTRFERGLQDSNVRYRFLPKSFTSPMSIDIFGNYSILYPEVELGTFNEDAPLTVIVNPIVADGYRKWFKALWDLSA